MPVAFSHNGGYVVANGKEVFSRNVPGELFHTLESFRRNDNIDVVTFTPNGGWTVVAGQQNWTRNVGGGYFQELKKLIRNGEKILSVAFNPISWDSNRGYIITYEGGFSAEHIPNEMRRKVEEFLKLEGSVDIVTFTPDGGWTIIAGQKSWTRNVGGDSPSYFEVVNQLLTRGHQVKAVAFNPISYTRDKGWLIVTDQVLRSRRVPRELRLQVENICNVKLDEIKRVRVELIDIHCRDTEDVIKNDEFFLIGTLAAGFDTKEVLTRPIKINDGQTRSFRREEQLIYDGPLDADLPLILAIKAFDQDAATTWDKYESLAKSISNGVALALTASGYPTAGKATAIVTEIVGGAIALDQDDELSNLSREIHADDFVPGTTIYSWHIKGSWQGGVWGWSTWDYTVRYRITADI